MKKGLLLILLFASFVSYEAMSQCGRVSLIGEFNGWAGDQFMTRNPENPAEFTTILSLTKAMNGYDPKDIIELKFRENADWTVNWGAAEFPAGTGVLGGPNIPVPIDTNAITTDYLVTFNCSTGAYLFTEICGPISLIGEFNGWAGDQFMTRDASNPALWSTLLTLKKEMNGYDPADIIDMKFRENADWTVNWGAAEFPAGTGVQNGPNIPIPIDTNAVTTDYIVTFNCTTGEYTFTEVCGQISMIGEFNGWSGDLNMTRRADNPALWYGNLVLTNISSTYDPKDIVDVKFRENADWGVNWGAVDFPTGIGVQNGPNIPVPIDTLSSTNDFFVVFNCVTGEYTFTATSGTISMIGEFNGWAGDVPMNQDLANPHIWTVTKSFPATADFENDDDLISSKFRENYGWAVNWGNNTFPTGTATANGPNIPVTAGVYDVTFNSSTGDYSFAANTTACGEIGMVGDFNSWGGDPGSAPTDVMLIRDPMYPSNFSIEYNFTSSTQLLFRLDGDESFTNVWGGTFPEGTGVMGTGTYLQVPGGKYQIYYNCQSHDFKFVRLGNSVIAPKVFAIDVTDGLLTETDWVVTSPVSQVVNGTVTADPNEAFFGVAYNAEYLFVGLSVTDAVLTMYEMGEVFIDGNKSGGAYDANDLHLRFNGPVITIVQGPANLEVLLGFMPNATGYTAELAIPLAALGITPEEGAQIGFDILLGDSDNNTSVEYIMAWNGGMQNYENTSSFGDLIYGVLSCGCVSLFSDNTGDVILQNPTSSTTTYVGTYELFEGQSMLFRKDMSETVSWGAADFPTGTATVGGDAIPATTGRYRVTFDCISGAYTFEADPMPAAGIAYAQYTTNTPVLDGDLQEYALNYNANTWAVGSTEVSNNTTWGAVWDEHSLYLGVQVEDAILMGLNNPWDSDAIEYYIDGNHDRDGTYDKDFDTQLIQDIVNNTAADTSLWIKADGVQITDWDAKWFTTTDGYNVELRLGWADFGFAPGKGRSLGFSLGNNDSDVTPGTRDLQTVWYGTGDNWSNTAVLGDLQLAGGPYFFGVNENKDYSAFVVLYPNPANSNVFLRLAENTFNCNVTILVSDMAGRTVQSSRMNFNGAVDHILLNADNFTPGIYFVNILGDNGQRAVKKLIVQ